MHKSCQTSNCLHNFEYLITSNETTMYTGVRITYHFKNQIKYAVKFRKHNLTVLEYIKYLSQMQKENKKKIKIK